MALFSRTPRASSTPTPHSPINRPQGTGVSGTAPVSPVSGLPAPLLKRLKSTPRFFQTRDRIIVIVALLLLVAAGVYALVSSYLNATTVIPKVGGTLREGIVGVPKYINPLYDQTSDADQDLTAVVYSGLMKLDSKYNVVPDLVSKVDVSADKKSYTLTLRQGVKWQDGVDFTANDVLFTIGAIQNQAYGSPLRPSLKGIELTKVNDTTVKFTLPEPYAPFLSSLTFGIMPAHIWESVSAKNAPVVEQNLKPVGTGPYKFKEFKKEKTTGQILSMTLERNTDYYGGAPYIETLDFHFYQNPDELIAAFNDGKIDSMNFIDSLSIAKVRQKDVNYHAFRLPVYTALFLNPAVNPVLNDVNVRRALVHGINRNDLIQNILGGHGIPATGPLLPGFLGYKSDVAAYNFDVAKAKVLITGAGYIFNEKDGYFMDNKGKRLKLHLQTTDWPQNAATANAIRDAWKAIGVECEVSTFTVSEIQQTFIHPRKFEVLLFSQNIGTDPDVYPFWHSSQAFDPGLNLSFLRDENMDNALERARRTSDSAQRITEYATVQKTITDSVGAVFLFSQDYLYPTTKKLEGFDMTNISMPSDRLMSIEKLFVKTKRVFNK